MIGSFKDLFDAATTHQPDGHLVVWSLRHLPDELRTVGTLLALDHIWRHIDQPTTASRHHRGPKFELPSGGPAGGPAAGGGG